MAIESDGEEAATEPGVISPRPSQASGAGVGGASGAGIGCRKRVSAVGSGRRERERLRSLTRSATRLEPGAFPKSAGPREESVPQPRRSLTRARAPEQEGRTSRAPEWATFEKSAAHWYNTLRNIGCDDASVSGLFLLAQHSDVGYMKANTAISKLFKCVANDRQLRNPIAFLHTICQNARHEMGRGR